jgi:hypothetical protein
MDKATVEEITKGKKKKKKDKRAKKKSKLGTIANRTIIKITEKHMLQHNLL